MLPRRGHRVRMHFLSKLSDEQNVRKTWQDITDETAAITTRPILRDGHQDRTGGVGGFGSRLRGGVRGVDNVKEKRTTLAEYHEVPM